MQKYNKFIVAAVIGLIAVVTSLYGSDNSYVTALAAIATALGVYVVPNK